MTEKGKHAHVLQRKAKSIFDFVSVLPRKAPISMCVLKSVTDPENKFRYRKLMLVFLCHLLCLFLSALCS